MDKKIPQDVISGKDRGIRKISLPLHRQSEIPSPRPKPAGKSRVGIWFVALFCVIFLIFSVTLLFSSAKVVVTPKHQDFKIDNIYVAKKNAQAGELPFTVMTLEKTLDGTVTGTGQKKVDSLAQGTVVIYNNYSSAPQILATNTRLAASNGKIYRLHAQVKVPGKTTVKGKTVPGSLEAIIYASAAGSDYNMKVGDLVGDFTIPGFVGSPKYKAFYARLKTDITGGQSGLVPVVNDSDVAPMQASLQASLKDAILREALAKKPDDFILFDTAYHINFDSLPPATLTGNKVDIKEHAVFSAILFNKNRLAGFILPAIASDIASGAVTIAGLEDMTFEQKNGQGTDLQSIDSLTFSLKGSLTSTSTYSSEALKRDLSGANASNLSSILARYPGIQSADVTIKPFWKRSFPIREDRITVESI